MSEIDAPAEQATDVAATVTEEATVTEAPAEVDWKQRSREWEKRAKANADAAERLAALEESQKSEAEKLAAAEAEAAAVPAKVATALRGYLIEREGIDPADADLFLTATEPDLLLKQFGRWVEQTGKRTNYVPREGQTTPPGSSDATREFIRAINGREQ